MAKDELHSSIQNIINDEKPTVRKSIVIGVGGSGMKGVLAAKKWIESNLPMEAHRYMRWVGIDTTDIETSIEGKGGKYRFPGDQFFQEEKRMLYISSPTPPTMSLEFLRDKYKNDECYNWLPNPDVYDISTRPGQGANQTRPIGRLAFYINEKKIRDAIIKERDRLDELSDNPKYFKLMDIKEGHEKVDETISFQIKRGVNRYNFRDKIPAEHDIFALEPDKNTRAILSPHTSGPLSIESFPSDEKGPYFEVSGSKMDGQVLSFRARHFKRGGQISIFITCSIVGGTGNGMILDLAATIKDIFKDYWPAPRIYGICVLPSAFKRVVYNRNARANAYAALKEIDYYMSGNEFKAKYPSGQEVNIPDRIFEDGMFYLLDVENMAGNSLQGRDQVQELTGQFIATFVASTVGGAIEERMVNDATRSTVYLPRGNDSKRKACYNSFGISRVIYPVPKLKSIGYKIIGMRMIKSFLKPVNKKLLLETLGDINRGLVRALRLNCRLIFERMYPDYKMDMEIEFRSYTKKIDAALKKGDKRNITNIMETVLRDYGKEEMEKIKKNMLLRMEKRYRVELGKIKTILTTEIHKFLKDPNKGFNFSGTIIDMLLAKLDLYQKKYYKERVSLARYSTEEMEKLIEHVDENGIKDANPIKAIIEMASFNFNQLVFEAMLTSAETFTREFKAMLFNLKNIEVTQLMDKVTALYEQMEQEIEGDKFELLQKKNPLFFYLINGNEINDFLKKYFYSRLSIEDLCNDIDFIQMDREDNKEQFIETYLISTEGLKILEMNSSEIKELIQDNYGNIIEKPLEEIKNILYGNDDELEEGLNLSETSILKIEIEKIKKKIFKIIHSRFEGFNFESISIKQMLDNKKIPVRRLLEKLDTFSRPYIYVDSTGLNAMEYYRTVTNFELDTYEEGNDSSTAQNDLPERMNHYKKRESALPNISVESFVVPNLCEPYEIISIGILLGFPIFKIESLENAARDYHSLIVEKSHPLHCFNHPTFNAEYFPDPFRMKNYLNPAKLWTGLNLLKIITKTEKGYQYEKALTGMLKDIEARENYNKNIFAIEKKIIDAGGFDNISIDALADAIFGLGMLAKNSDEKLQFRREYSLAIRDILDGDGTGERATSQDMSKDEYIEKFIKSPQFNGIEELITLLENEYNVRQFLISSVIEVIERSKGNSNAGADIKLPQWKIDKVELPIFKDKYAFFDYFEKRASLEWQNLLKERLVTKLHDYVNSAKFRLESDPTLLDKTKVDKFLELLDQKVPEIVLWEVKVNNKVIK